MTDPAPCYLLTPKGADVAQELTDADRPRTLVLDHQETAERIARDRTPDGEAWRDHFDLYEVRPVIS
jgi:hypothetical protein